MREVDTSEIDRRLSRESANNGDVQVSLMWNSLDDLDIHITTPHGECMNYLNRRSTCGGCLDVDANRDASDARVDPVENVFWPAGKAPSGTYQVQVQLYRKRSSVCSSIDFQLRVQNRGASTWYRGRVYHAGHMVHVTSFTSRQSVPPLSVSLGTLFKGSFSLHLEVLDVEEQGKMDRFVNMLCSSLGATSSRYLNNEQLSELPRLCKMLERMDDANNFAGEKANAARALQSCLAKLHLDEDSLRSACGGLSGKDVEKPTLATLTFTKKVTSRRAWFEETAETISHPMGVIVTVNKARGPYGRVGHNGVSLIGTPAATITAAAFIAKVAETALMSCTKSDTDSFCGCFCRQIIPMDTSDANARSAALRRSSSWLESRFSANADSAAYNTPKKFRQDTPTAALGRLTGAKRALDFTHESEMATKLHRRALMDR